jgi:hypothetical protein
VKSPSFAKNLFGYNHLPPYTPISRAASTPSIRPDASIQSCQARLPIFVFRLSQAIRISVSCLGLLPTNKLLTVHLSESLISTFLPPFPRTGFATQSSRSTPTVLSFGCVYIVVSPQPIISTMRTLTSAPSHSGVTDIPASCNRPSYHAIFNHQIRIIRQGV